MKILKMENVKYNSDNSEILKGISFDVEKGECISIVGQSGSGKSTLLKIIADLLPISGGNIYFNGRLYNSYNPVELRRRISYCTQIPQLFGNKVAENLEFPFRIRKEKTDIKRIIELLQRFNLDESYLDSDVDSLSGGEKQRISIIRNLLYKPEIILLDESTSSLDTENAMIIEKYIKELNDHGTTVLWITHSIDQSRRIFDKRIVISEGRVECVEVLK